MREPSRLGDVSIVLGANLLHAVPVPQGKRLILFNLEQITPGSPWLTDAYLALLRRYPVWDYSEEQHRRARPHGHQGCALRHRLCAGADADRARGRKTSTCCSSAR